MFFSLSKTKDSKFPNHTRLGSWILNHDNGWLIDNESCFKGYRTESHGNYIEFRLVNDDIILNHDKSRGFPLYWSKDQKILTNFFCIGEPIWADQQVRVCRESIELTKLNLFDDITTTESTLDAVVQDIASKLRDCTNELKCHYFYSPKKLFPTGGLDTTLIYAVSKNVRLDFEILNSFHIDYDYFLNQNFDYLKKSFWGYTQIHHWKQPSILMSGAFGDEFFMRGPSTAATWAAWHDIDIIEILEKSSGYHKKYFQKQKNIEIFKKQFDDRRQLRKKFPEKNYLNRSILDRTVNDFQHWHLGNTLTWTPLKNLEFTNMILNLPVNDVISQIVDGAITKKIISHLYPDALNFLSDNKNFSSREKFFD